MWRNKERTVALTVEAPLRTPKRSYWFLNCQVSNPGEVKHQCAQNVLVFEGRCEEKTAKIKQNINEKTTDLWPRSYVPESRVTLCFSSVVSYWPLSCKIERWEWERNIHTYIHKNRWAGCPRMLSQHCPLEYGRDKEWAVEAKFLWWFYVAWAHDHVLLYRLRTLRVKNWLSQVPAVVLKIFCVSRHNWV
jgi:hypothetical protein